MALGLCTTCRQPNDQSTRRCRACTTKAVEQNVRARREARRNKVCVECRQPWAGETKRCPECKQRQRAKWNGRAGTDYCTRCAGPRDGKAKTCSDCRKKMRESTMTRRKNLAAQGRCVQCGATQDAGSEMYCRMHILKLAAYRWLEDVHRWRELDQLLIAQGERCAYTGEQLILGVNASIDHKIPRARGGLNTLDNIQWVTWTVNRCKTDLSHEEFISLCRIVVARTSSLP